MLTTILLSLPAPAHVGGLLQGVEVQHTSGVTIETSFGVLRAADGENYAWLCHEAITTAEALITPRYAVSGDGVLLGVVPVPEQARDKGLALYRTLDGCDWSTPTGADGLTITDAAFDPSDADRALLITADLADGADNYILTSSDAGQSFSPVLTAAERLFRTVEISPGGTVWVSAVWYDRDEGYLYRSDDGEGFTEHAVPIPDSELPVDVDVIAVSPDDPMTAWVVVGGYGDDTLQHTTDGGKSFVEVFSTAGDIISGTTDSDGAVWIVVSGQLLYRSVDGVSFTEVTSAPTGLAISAAAVGVWMATDAIVGGGAIAQRSTDGGASFDLAMHLSTLSPPPTCAAESHSAVLCDPLWEALKIRLPLPLTEGDSGDTDTDTGSTDQPDTGTLETSEDCGCGDSEGAAVVLLGIGLLGLRRRR